MIIQVFSDLHLRGSDTVPPLMGHVRTVVLAGDLGPHSRTRLIHVARQWYGANILYVPGNHEFYGYEMAMARAAMRKDCHDMGITLLDPGIADIDGIRFIGATLWTDMALHANGDMEADVAKAMRDASSLVGDFRGWIRDAGSSHPKGWFTPEQSVRQHEREVAFIERSLEQASRDGMRAVVVTHHAPTPASVQPWWKGNALNPCFASDLDDLIVKWKPLAWIHGHMHDSVRAHVGATAILSNPRGYSEHENRNGFDPRFNVKLHG